MLRTQKPVIVISLLLVMLTALLSGCPAPADRAKEAESGYLTVEDDAGRAVTLPRKPERIVVLSTSYLDLLYAVGGQAIGRPTTPQSERLPPEAAVLTELGQTTNIDVEKLIALQPDLVIAYQGLHEKLVPLLNANHVPVLLLKMKTYEDVRAKLLLFGEIAGTGTVAASVAQQLTDRVRVVTDRLPAQSRKVVILHVTAKNITVELGSSIAGDVAGLLQLRNIAAESLPLAAEQAAAPFSLEKLVEGDPDVIMVTMMGKTGEVQKRLRDEVENNPAWAGMRAVRAKQVYFLPGDLFQLNPGVRYDEAVAYMARVVYPEVYGHGR